MKALKDATVSARVETDIKDKAESILHHLGVPVSVVINSLYRQIIYHNGIPFSLSIPTAPDTLDSLSREQLDAKLQHSYDQAISGIHYSSENVFQEIERRHRKE